MVKRLNIMLCAQKKRGRAHDGRAFLCPHLPPPPPRSRPRGQGVGLSPSKRRGRWRGSTRPVPAPSPLPAASPFRSLHLLEGRFQRPSRPFRSLSGLAAFALIGCLHLYQGAGTFFVGWRAVLRAVKRGLPRPRTPARPLKGGGLRLSFPPPHSPVWG